MKMLRKRLERLLRAFRLQRDVAVREIADPACKPQGSRLLSHKGTEPHSLHVPGYDRGKGGSGSPTDTRVQAVQSQVASMGTSWSRKRAAVTLTRPSGVKRAPCRATRVGRAESKRSMPRAMPSRRSSG